MAVVVAAIEGAVVVGGLSALGGALAGIGIPENSVLKYEAELRVGKFLLIAHGTHEEVERAKQHLDRDTSRVTAIHAEPVAVMA